MPPVAATRRRYDHRVREAVCHARDPQLLPELEIPRSTARSWIERGAPRVVTSDRLDRSRAQLVAQVALLERRIDRLRRLLRLLAVLLRALGGRGRPLPQPDGLGRRRVMQEIEAARPVLGLARILRLLGISAARLHAWRHEQDACEDAPAQGCPRLHPQQLTRDEVRAMEMMATDPAYRHMSLRALAMVAMRIGRVFASPATWARLARKLGWRRPRRRVYPARPRTGIRAGRPDEYWHMDVTVIRLLDGTRVYLHAVIDNFSRKILAWRLAGRLAAVNTCELLREAAIAARNRDGAVRLVTDAGVENINQEVDRVLQEKCIRHIVAQIHVSWSNSLIERFWTSLRHGWLYLNVLDSFSAVERHVAFFVQQHNEVMPHSAFHGQTPDEMYCGTGDGVPAALAAARQKARQKRLEENRAVSCRSCPLTPM